MKIKLLTFGINFLDRLAERPFVSRDWYYTSRIWAYADKLWELRQKEIAISDSRAIAV